MKKSTKISLIISLAFIAIGSILYALGLHYGGYDEAKELSSQIMDKYGLHVPVADNYLYFEFNSDKEKISGDYTGNFDLADVDNLNINIGAADLKFSDSSNESIDVTLDGMNTSQVYIEGDTLIICSQGSSMKGKVEIAIPKSARFNDVNIEAGAAEMKDISLECNRITMELGAGDAKLSSLNVSDSATFEIGAGNLEIKNAAIADMDADLGMGNLEFNGLVSGNLTVDCGMGNAEFSFTDSADNHNFDLEASMGNIELNKNKDSGLGNHMAIDNNADSDYVVECGMGNIEINFAK